MPDPALSRPVAPGQRLDIPAAVWNQVLAAVADYLRTQRGRTGPPDGAADGYPAADVVFVRNDTGADLDARAVVSPSGDVLNAAEQPLAVQRRPVFAADEPGGADSPALILLEPIADGKIGRAVAGGIAVVTVSVSSGSHLWARPTAGVTAKLESADSGPARILTREAGSSGDKVAIVCLNNGGIVGGVTASSAPAAGLDGAYALLAQVDSSTGSPRDHTVTAQDLTGGSPGDTGAAFSGVYLSDGSQAPNNCYLALFLSSSGDYFGVPAQPASGTQPGWVSTAAQTFAGDKTFADDITVDQYSTLTGGATVAGSAGGAGIGSYPDNLWSLRVGKTLVVGGASGTAIRLAAGSWSTTDYSEINASGYQLFKSSAAQIELETVNLGGGQQGRARVAYNGTNFPGGNQNPAGGGSTPQFVGGIYVAGTVLGSITSGDVTGALGYTPLDPANNLSDVANAASALSNLGGQASLGFTPLDPANNLSDVGSASAAATNLGLGGGLTGTYTFGGGATGDVADMTFTNGVLTAVTLVP